MCISNDIDATTSVELDRWAYGRVASLRSDRRNLKERSQGRGRRVRLIAWDGTLFRWTLFRQIRLRKG